MPLREALATKQSYKQPMFIKYSFFLIAVILAAIQAWHTRYYITNDGISYLDIGDAYFKGDFKTAINAYWSPLYSIIIGFVMSTVKPTVYFEYPLLHLIQLITFIFSIFCFNFFLDTILKYSENKSPLPTWSLQIISYSTFLYTSLKFTPLWFITPDLLLSCIAYLIYGYLIKAKYEKGKTKTFIILGILFGFAYLTKAAYIAFIISSLVVLILLKIGNLKNIILTILLFSIIGFPYIYAISSVKENFTFSDAGKLNYIWNVNNVTNFYMVHWQGYPENFGIPAHSTNQVYSSPNVYTFNTPFNVTYPPWFNPSYWYEGIKADFNPRYYYNFIKRNFKDYFLIFVLFQGGLISSFLYLVIRSKNNLFIKQYLFLLIPTLCIFFSYAIIFTELRYIASFTTVFWTLLFSSIVIDKNKTIPIKLSTFALLLSILFTLLFSKFYKIDYAFLRDFQNKKINNTANCDVAKGLYNLGLKEGDHIASFGYGHYAYWARLGRFKIVSEIPNEELKKYWELDKNHKKQIRELLKISSAKAIVINNKPKDELTEWIHIPKTTAYVSFLK